MTFQKGAICLLLIHLVLDSSLASTKYLIKISTNASDLFKTKKDNLRIIQDPIAVTKSPLQESNFRFEDANESKINQKSKFERRNSYVETSTFNPEVLNKFLEEYASKIKSTTDNNYKYPFTMLKPPAEGLEIDHSELMTTTTDREDDVVENGSNSTLEIDELNEDLNDTLKRNKYWGNSAHDDRNGWVTLEAIPWSKSKISKWQASHNTQRPWPEAQKPWEKPNSGKPWFSDYPARPNYENNKPSWYDKPKPHWSDISTNEKPWYLSDRPSPNRPSYLEDNTFDNNPNQAQKWPPERPWDQYSDSHKPNSDIITDDRPSNFPGNWERPQISKPTSYTYDYDRFLSKNNEEDSNDWKSHNYKFPSKLENPNGNSPRPISFDRPHFSQYQYSTEHPSSHPSTGDGQWVLLSTNRGYSKTRQRSIKIDAPNAEAPKALNMKNEDLDSTIPVMTSKRQVRLTVLPSVNGTNTTTSHGGLLEVERTFKTVDQSQKEYERDQQPTLSTILKKRPTKSTLSGQPSNSAVLAAVGAGMLPATMAMMIPMMLGRKRRSSEPTSNERNLRNTYDLEDELHDFTQKVYNQRTRLLRM